ncbi:hypothetical protein NBH00_18780 [Paraconexibacter antarcticus]|uniref:Anti-sigma factor n=1 Tax=Paraconexibacter antarcticus TaxID=2949664 RepID=A0ABY5DS33_9ACTN|nr:hypothetical protein [Paraconexibacter antarcticus]UTI63384.1 hypothetical protein NBH00_18780 [Paraconexibacter antarcticus]
MSWHDEFADVPVLGELGAEVERVAHTRRSRRRFGLRIAPLLGIGVAVAAGGAVAATQLIGTGQPVPRLPAGGQSVLGSIVPGSVRLLSVRAADPDGGPPWGIRMYQTKKGIACVQVGRVVAG